MDLVVPSIRIEHICCSYRIRLSAPGPAERRYRGLCPLVTHNWAMVLAPVGASISCCVLPNPICLPVCLSHRCLRCWVQMFATRKGRGQTDHDGSGTRSGANPPPPRFLGEALDSMVYIPTASSLRFGRALSPCCRAWGKHGSAGGLHPGKSWQRTSREDSEGRRALIPAR